MRVGPGEALGRTDASQTDRTTPTGVIINDFLTRKVDVSDETIHLLYAANRWEKNQQIKSLLEQGVTVVSDRYAYSGSG